ncbi:MAG: hypothetical protein AB8V06_01895 [Francisella endosymbiont of Hyalomma asiaticum]
MGIIDRGRRDQMRMAREWGIEDYASPHDGYCFLTNKQYYDKLVDLCQARSLKEYESDDISFLRLVDILALSFIYKLIIGRKEGENNYLNGYKNQFISIYCSLHIGPLTLIDGGLTKMMSNTQHKS